MDKEDGPHTPKQFILLYFTIGSRNSIIYYVSFHFIILL